VSLNEDKTMTDIIVIGAGPAGVLATLRAAELGAHTTLVASGEFGGVAANDGPVPCESWLTPLGCFAMRAN